MATLIYAPDAMRARAAKEALRRDPLLGAANGGEIRIEVARSLAEARMKLLSGGYRRLALHRGDGAAAALFAAARAGNPDCEMVDLGSMRVRPISGGASPADQESAPNIG